MPFEERVIFRRPPGQTLYALLPNNLGTSELLESLDEIQIKAIQNFKTRLLWDDPNYQDFVNNFKWDSKIKYKPYQTIFYSLNFNEINTLIASHNHSWDRYQDDLETILITPDKTLERQVLLDFMLWSNGVDFKSVQGKTVIQANTEAQTKIEQNLALAMSKDYNYFYLVRTKQKPCQYAGVYTLTTFGKSEIQLHYLSGKSQNYSTVKGKKMPILTASMLSRLLADFGNYQRFTFSNSDYKTRAVYQGAGFRPVTHRRSCILLGAL